MTGDVMRAAVFEGVERITVRDVAMAQCHDDSMVVKVEACGICGSDIRNFHNGLRTDVSEQIMGHEIAGVVSKVGRLVTDFKIGDRVAIAPDVSCGHCYYCKRGLVNLCINHRMIGTHWPGGFAQYIHVPREALSHGFVEHIPEGLDFDEAALAEPAASVIACQEYNNVDLGDTVVIIGDGPIACLHVEVARARGASQIIVAGMDKLSLVSQFDPDVLMKNDKPEMVIETVMKQTDGLGADIAICAVPVVKTHQQALEMVRKRGKVIIYGGVSKNNPMTVLNSNIIHYNEISIVGAFSYPAIGLEQSLKFIAEGRISAKKYVTKIVSLDDIAQGIQYSEQGKALKVVVKPWIE